MRHDDETELLTIRDIAAVIAFGDSEAAIGRALRQVRHWTQNDLLETYGDKNTGRGVPRLYEEERTIEIAAILIELSRYGVTLEVMKPVAEELYSEDADLYLLETETDPKRIYPGLVGIRSRIPVGSPELTSTCSMTSTLRKAIFSTQNLLVQSSST